jgi:hypothetical protein
MKVRLAIADSSRVVELEVDGAEFESMVEGAFGGEAPLLWVEDVKERRVGIPTARIAYVEIESQEGPPTVGFASGS